MNSHLKTFHISDNTLEAGIDESGAGPLFGRVYAACVIIDPNIEIHPYLNDSKKVTGKRRKVVRDWIEENALDFNVAWCDEKRVDEINILNARIESMHKALNGLSIEPEHLLVDGNSFKPYVYDMEYFIPHTLVINGDGIYASIAAASILAKEYHDDYIIEMCTRHPELDTKYHLLCNKGYGTPYHKWAITEYGPTDYHRKSFLKFMNNL